MALQRREEIDYLAAVARIRVLETRLLKAQELDRMLDMDAAEEVWKMVREFFDLPEEPLSEFEAVLGDYLTNSYRYVAGFLPGPEVVDWLGVRNDYHNLKVLLKEAWLGEEADEGAFSRLGTVTVNQLRAQLLAASDSTGRDEHRPEVPMSWQVRLPDSYQRAVTEAETAYASTRDPQVIDVVLDRWQLTDAREVAAVLGDEVQFLASILAEMANLKILLRSNKLGKTAEFLRLALVQGGRISSYRWEAGHGSPAEEVASLLGSPYDELIRSAEGDPGRVERAADNYVMELLRKSRYVAMGPWPVVAFLWAKESDVRNVRIVLSGKLNGAITEAIRERLRDTYV